MPTGCTGRSCMAELQWQLMLVFTTKTMMKKTIEIGKPFIHSYLASRSARDAGEEVRRCRCVPAQTLARGVCRPGFCTRHFRRCSPLSGAASGPFKGCARPDLHTAEADHFQVL